MALLSEDNKRTSKEISSLLNTPERTIDRDIEKLKQEGKLKRIGGRKNGYWEIQSKVNK